MRTKSAVFVLTVISLFTGFAPPMAAVDQNAPDFVLKGVDGKNYRLSDLKGSYVVLEWVNFGCPFVQKHYRSGNMPALQKFAKEKGVVWLSVCSSAPGKQGYFEGDALKSEMRQMNCMPTAYLPDPEGTVGRLYGARATPTMYVIDPRGNIIYGGGIDDIPSTDVNDIPKARNYVKEALELALSGKRVEVSTSKAYGCSVKY
jgi:hypothetical protein